MEHLRISWARYVQENRKMRFLEAYERWNEGRLSQTEAALLLGQRERSFRRHIERYKADGMDGLLDKRLIQISKRRASGQEVDHVVQLYKHGKTWGQRGQTPVLKRPGQRQSVSAASAVNSKGGFWFETYEGGLTGELFVQLLKNIMCKRKKAVHLVVDGLPAHKKALVKEYVLGTKGKLTLHFLPGYAPDLNPDELVWRYAKRTGPARRPLQKGEKLQDKVNAQLQAVADNPALVRSFFGHPSVAYIADR